MKLSDLPPHLREIAARAPTRRQVLAGANADFRRAIGNVRSPAANVRSGVLTLLPAHGTPGPWRLEIDNWRPTLNNDLLRAHRLRRSKLKSTDAKVLLAACLEAGVPVATTMRRLRVSLRYPAGRTYPDGDAVAKSLRDGLVIIDALVDDSTRWLDGADCEVEDVRGGLRTTIHLEDC